MKIRMFFELGEDDDSGRYGARPLGEPEADFAPGLTSAHDIIEHFPNVPQSYGVAGEWMALGAALYLRWESGFAVKDGQQTKSFSKWLATDAAEVCMHKLTKGYRFMELNRIPKTSRYVEIEDVDEYLSDWVELGMEAIFDEYEERISDHPKRMPEVKAWPESDWRYLMVESMPWVKLGYQKAARRYHKVDAYTYCTEVFDFIRKSVDEGVFEHLEKSQLEHHRMLVTCNTHDYDAKVIIYSGHEMWGFYEDNGRPPKDRIVYHAKNY